MDSHAKANMFEYYNERAGEYEELYTQGAGPASIPDPEAYKTEVAVLKKIVNQHGFGEMIDIACGTGFWLPHYAAHCSHITLLDQSPNMLFECDKKIKSLKIQDRCTLLEGDFLDYPFGRGRFDFALAGFFVSHLDNEEEQKFFVKLGMILKPRGQFLLFDSTWNEERAKTRAKQGNRQRTLNDGRTFDIYKRYFDESDIEHMAQEYQFSCSIEHLGQVFAAVLGTFQ